MAGMLRIAAAIAVGIALAGPASAAEPPKVPDAAKIELTFAQKIPLRDGVELAATVYRPKGQPAPAPCIFTLTPYTRQGYHDRGVWFAAHGLPFLTVDARGRGDSGGQFRPLIQEARDAADVVEWLAKQPYCSGKVSMWGGSYAGYNQWAAAKERPPHLATIVPVASPYPGADFPYRNNIAGNYLLQWLTFTSGATSQGNLFGDQAFWPALWRKRFEEGAAYNTLEKALGGEQPTLREWVEHPQIDAYYDAYAPTPEQFRALDLPILSITGHYDGDQPGAMAFYQQHMKLGSEAARASHYLIIGPWDHAGTRTPRAEVGGVAFGPASLVDLPQLHLDWYAWTMAGGDKPAFLKKRVAYYVTGAEAWRYADTLEGVTAREQPFFLDSIANPDQLTLSGFLDAKGPGKGKPDSYVYDPRDVSIAALETEVDGASLIDQRLVHARQGKSLIYHTPVFDEATEVSGFFRLSAWIAIDQPDTDFEVSVYEIEPGGRSILLSTDVQRARYRESLREAKLVSTRAPQRYDFDKFTFVSRQIAKGSRLRLVIGPINSINAQKNYNSGKPVSEETMADARTVKVTLVHDKAHPSALYVPLGQPAN